MSYESSIELLLKEGVQFWNNLRESSYNNSLDDEHLNYLVTLPDFSFVNFWHEFLALGKPDDQWPISLTGIDLVEADLRGAMLRLVDLSCAVLAAADFRGANLNETVLTEADLRDADLLDTQLTKANLTKADLRGAILTDADLSDAILKNADVTTANFIGADLSGTELWKAKLFTANIASPSQYQGQQIPIGSIGSLLSEFRKIKEHHVSQSDEIAFYFRGEQKCGWKLSPSAMREHFALSESEMLLKLISRHPEEFSEMPSALAQWMLAQHHGLKTRFLDVTKNPLVALFHACEDNFELKGSDACLHIFAVPRPLVKSFNSDTASVIANFAKLSNSEQSLLLGKKVRLEESTYRKPRHYQRAMGRLCQLIQEEKPYFQNRIDVRDLFRVIVVEPQQLSERLRAQSGAFLVSAFHDRFDRNKIERKTPNIPVYAHYTLSVPHRSKPRILEDLQLINIRRETLFPGLDESAKEIIGLS